MFSTRGKQALQEEFYLECFKAKGILGDVVLGDVILGVRIALRLWD
jgi:hypothetical protein